MRGVGRRLQPAPKLRFAPPSATGASIYYVTNDPASRDIRLAANENAVVVLPNYPLTFIPCPTQNEAIVQIFSGNNIRVIGGEIVADPGPLTCFLAAPMTGTDLTVQVNSTAGFPAYGTLRIDGEQLVYGSKTATAFNVTARRSGYYNSSPYSSDQAHATGAIVYRGEYARTGLSLSNGHAMTHVEGVRFRGFLCDAIRFSGSTVCTGTLSNIRTDPSTNHDPLGQRDAHPDAVQVAGGCTTLRLERSTFQGGRSGRGFLNSSTDSGNPLSSVEALDTEWVMTGGGQKAIDNTADATVPWKVSNCWIRTGTGSLDQRRADTAYNSPQVTDLLGYGTYPDQGPDFCPEGIAGIGYASPGYL